MRAVVQRVKSSKVTVEEKVVGQINRGLMVLLGVGNEDSYSDVDYLAEKIINLRIFEDNNGKMNLSLPEVGGEMLVVHSLHYSGIAEKEEDPAMIKLQGLKLPENSMRALSINAGKQA